MQNSSYVLTETHEINTTLHIPISSTQRIKYTCLTTSESYIAVGSTSGSIYLFSREPCSFIKLIPLLQGSICHIQISPNEKLIALATVRGAVCLVTLSPTFKLIGISNEHVGERVEYICWNDSSTEVYVGDANGKVSVVVNSIFSANGMFQPPTCSLMNLDSGIVQMSYESSLLLISTLTRSYLCNTTQEQYKQIGNQTRDGEYGACFFKLTDPSSKLTPPKPENETAQRPSKVRTFDFISENEPTSLDENLRIFCARPGSRLWEVNTNGIVIKTHQFKEALAVPSQPVYKLYGTKSVKIEKSEKVAYAQSIQFFQLMVLQRKYLLSYAPTGMYIIDPINASVVLWTGDLRNIHSLSIQDNKVYLMTRSGQFRCLNVCTVEAFILKLYERKLYNECLRALTVLKTQVVGEEEKAIDENDLERLVGLIRNHQTSSPKTNGKASGIVVVNSGTQSVDTSNLESEEILFRSKTHSKNSNTKPTDNAKKQAKESKDKRILCDVQEKLKPVYSVIESLKLATNSEKVEQQIRQVRDILDGARREYESELCGGLTLVFRTTELHCNNSFLESVSPDMIEYTGRWSLVELVKEVFLETSLRGRKNCQSCQNPLPCRDGSSEPRFSSLGIALLRRYKQANDREVCLAICSNVPFFWMEYVSDCDKGMFDSDDVLKRAVLTRDKGVLAVTLRSLSPERWGFLGKVVEKLEIGRCLFCDKTVDGDGGIRGLDWNETAREINRINGPEGAVKFMNQVMEFLPNVQFDNGVMRQLIFAKILNRNGIAQNVELDCSASVEDNSICSIKIQNNLEPLLKADLGVSIGGCNFGSGSHHWGMKYSPKNSSCSSCTLPLQTPVLLGNNGIALFPCGHAYHVNCMIKKKFTRCNLHTN